MTLDVITVTCPSVLALRYVPLSKVLRFIASGEALAASHPTMYDGGCNREEWTLCSLCSRCECYSIYTATVFISLYNLAGASALTGSDH